MFYQTKSTNLSWSSLLKKNHKTLNQKGTIKLDQSYNKREKQDKAAVIYNLVAYGLFAVIFGKFTRIKLVFNRKVIRMRNKCSSYFILTSGLYLAIIFVFTQLRFNKATLLFMINAIIFIVSIITLSSWITSIFKNEHALNGFQNIYGLGTCFLGGVFVSNNILPNFVNKIACFTPVYWFTRNNNLIGETIKFDAKFFKSFTETGLIIIGFALAFWTLEVLEERILITKYGVKRKIKKL